MTTIAEMLVTALADQGTTQIWGVVGDALNPVVDAIRREDRIEWMGVRHEEAGAFAASAQAQLTGNIAVCMGTVGPGAIHLINGLYDAQKSHAPVLAIVGQVPTPEIGSSYFQEINNDRVFDDVSVFTATVTHASQMPQLLEQAVNTAIARQGVAVLSLPGDVSGLRLPHGVETPRFAPRPVPGPARTDDIAAAAAALNAAERVTIIAGLGARHARSEVLRLAETLSAPVVITLKAKEGLEDDNPYQVGQTGLIGNPGAARALEHCDTLIMVGTDFPYRDFLPAGKHVIQLDRQAEHIGRRITVDTALVGDSALTLQALQPQLQAISDTEHLDAARTGYTRWLQAQQELADPGYDDKLIGKLRAPLDNPGHFVRPEGVAAALDDVCSTDTIFTSDTGMSTVWLSRLLPMRGNRRLIGSYNLGSMANAMPMALGAQALDRSRHVVALCGDGGLMMLLGDLRTAVTYELPVTFVVFNNQMLGMVKLEQEEAGIPEFGTALDNPNIAEVARAMGLRSHRVTKADELHDTLAQAVDSREPWLVEVLTNPNEVSVPGKVELHQAFGFARSKVREMFSDNGPTDGRDG